MSYQLYTYPGGKIYLDLDEGDYAHRMLRGEWEPNLLRVMLQELQPRGCFVDCGAHVGYYALWAAKLVGIHGTVVAYEPSRPMYKQLDAGVRANIYLHMMPMPFALGDGLKIRQPLFQRQGSMMTTLSDALSDTVVQECLVTTIDSQWEIHHFPLPDMMKIDVEGAELDLIAGARATIAACDRLTLLINIHPELGVEFPMLADVLQPMGFRLERLENGNEVVARK